MEAVPIVLSVLLGVVFLVAGLPKLAGAAPNRVDLPPSVMPAIGLVEVAAAGLLAAGVASSDPGLARVGAALLVLTMLGALAAHLRIRDRWTHMTPAAVLGLIAVATVVVAG